MRLSPSFFAPLPLLGLIGCSQAASDGSRVLANVGGTKITEAELGALVRVLVKDPAQAQAILTEGAQRSQILEQMATSKAVMQLAKAEGLDQDAKVRARVESAVTQVYINSLLERRTGEMQPQDSELRAQYQAASSQSKLMGRKDLPPYEQVREQLVARWQQGQQQRMAMGLQKELMEKVRITFAEEGR